MSVLEAVAAHLKKTNRILASSENVKFHGTPQILTFIKPSASAYRRVLSWAFAALANLDSLQAMDADVAHELQIIRRCCRWIKNVVVDAELRANIHLIEVLVQDFFCQR